MLSLSPRSLKSVLLTHETALLLLVVVTGALGAMWAYFWLQSSRESVRLNAMLYEAQQIRGDLYTQLKQATRAHLLEEPSALQHYQATKTVIDNHFRNLEQSAADAQERLVIDYMRRTYQTVQEDLDHIAADPYQFSQAVRMKVLDPLYEEWMLAEFESALLIFDEVIAKRRRALEQALNRWAGLAPWLVPLPIIVALGLLVWSRASLQRRFVQPMAQLAAGARFISAGHLEQRIPMQGVAEVSAVAQAFNEMTQSLADSRAALLASERQAALGALVPVVAHNIRNPLASIRATAQLLDTVAEPCELIEARGAIIDTVDRLERWVSVLLSYLHPLKPQLRPLSLARLIEGALAPLRAKLADKHISLSLDNPAVAPIRVLADSDLLEQALYGLLNNAADAAPAGSTLTIRVTAQANDAVVIIDDEGAGIPFEPQPSGLTPGPSTKRFGTGLGIPFAFKVCAAHGGSLAFTRLPQRGTRVRLTVPLAPAEQAA